MSIASAALADADLCVKCGLCLPHCPTYALDAHEARGPRGRIALAQGLLGGALPHGAVAAAHLDGCLSCRACEAVCPAKVPYGRILDAARAELATPQRTRLIRWLAVLFESPALRAMLRLTLWMWTRADVAMKPRRARPRARAGTETSGRLKLLAYRPKVARLTAVTAAPQAEIALFTGCVGDVAERAVLQDAQRLFRASDIEVAIPPAQGCCGALQQHAGLPAQAARRAARNTAAFAACSTVLPLATGCGAALRDLGQAGHGNAAPLAAKVQDLCAALAARLDAQPVPLRAMPLRVGVHVACTQANVFGARHAARQLLARIPGIELIDLGPGCCGAAGTAFITQPVQAKQLLQPKLDRAADVDVIVSANIGCSMHFLAGLDARGASIPVLHPVSLLAQALD